MGKYSLPENKKEVSSTNLNVGIISNEPSIHIRKTEHLHITLDTDTKLLAKKVSKVLDVSLGDYISYLIQKDYTERYPSHSQKTF